VLAQHPYTAGCARATPQRRNPGVTRSDPG
jgi:hypothetical protein